MIVNMPLPALSWSRSAKEQNLFMGRYTTPTSTIITINGKMTHKTLTQVLDNLSDQDYHLKNCQSVSIAADNVQVYTECLFQRFSTNNEPQSLHKIL